MSGVLDACPLITLRTVPKFAEENCKATTSYRGYVGSGVSKANTVSLSLLTDMPDVGESLIHAMPLPMVACISLPVTVMSKLSAAYTPLVRVQKNDEKSAALYSTPFNGNVLIAINAPYAHYFSNFKRCFCCVRLKFLGKS